MALVIIVRNSQGATVSMRHMGFYTYRKTLWGSDALKDLGLTLLPMLENHDFGIGQENLHLLEIEAQVMEEHLTNIYAQIKPSASNLLLEDLEAYIANIRKAVQEARLMGGTISVQ